MFIYKILLSHAHQTQHFDNQKATIEFGPQSMPQQKQIFKETKTIAMKNVRSGNDAATYENNKWNIR